MITVVRFLRLAPAYVTILFASAGLMILHGETPIAPPLAELVSKYNSALQNLPDCRISASIKVSVSKGAMELQLDPKFKTASEAHSVLSLSGIKWKLAETRPDGSTVGPAAFNGKSFQYVDAWNQLHLSKQNPQTREPLLAPYNVFFKPFSYFLTEQNVGNGLYTVVPTTDLQSIYRSFIASHANVTIKDSTATLTKDIYSQGSKLGVLTMEFDGANAFYPTKAKIVSDKGVIRSDYSVTKVGYLPVKIAGVAWNVPYPSESTYVEYSETGEPAYTLVSSITLDTKKIPDTEFTIDPNTVDSIYDADADIIVPTHVTH